ncbi:MAG: class I SAM-dependent methyltransferase [Sphingomicrobium sp.]
MDYYREQGDIYLDHRKGARSEHNQRLRASLFQDLGGPDLTILDFGCGTGGVLSKVPAGNRVGVEMGEAAAQEARARGITVHSSLDDVGPASVDVAISFHAIEHTEEPLTILRGIRQALKPGGRARLIVPCELPLKVQRHHAPNVEQHLYTWTPRQFGNLAERAGFQSIATVVRPMPSGSRGAKTLKPFAPLEKAWLHYLALRDNTLNTILDATA